MSAYHQLTCDVIPWLMLGVRARLGVWPKRRKSASLELKLCLDVQLAAGKIVRDSILVVGDICHPII